MQHRLYFPEGRFLYIFLFFTKANITKSNISQLTNNHEAKASFQIQSITALPLYTTPRMCYLGYDRFICGHILIDTVGSHNCGLNPKPNPPQRCQFYLDAVNNIDRMCPACLARG